MKHVTSSGRISFLVLLLYLVSDRTVHGVIPIPSMDHQAVLHHLNPESESGVGAEGGKGEGKRRGSGAKEFKSSILESVIVKYCVEESADVVLPPDSVQNEEENCTGYDTDEEWSTEDVDGEGGFPPSPTQELDKILSKRAKKHRIPYENVHNHSRKSRKDLLLKIMTALQNGRITTPRDFIKNLQLTEEEVSLMGESTHRGGADSRGRRGGGGRRGNGGRDKTQFQKDDTLWVALSRERDRLRTECEEVSRRNYCEAGELPNDPSLQATIDAQTIWEADPNHHLTVFCAWVRDCHDHTKKFTFCSGEGLMVSKYRQAAERLGYAVVKTGGGHAEMQFLQFLYKRHRVRPGLYTHIVAMGCTQRHCKECDCVLRLVLGSQYREASTAVMERSAAGSAEETHEGFVLPLQCRVAQHEDVVEERTSDKFLITEDPLNLIKNKIPEPSDAIEQSIRGNYRHCTAKRKAE